MKTTKSGNINFCLNKTTCLILTLLIVSFVLSSCTGSRSVRSGKGQYIIVQPEQEEKNEVIDNDESIRDKKVAEFIKLVEKNKSEETNSDNEEDDEENNNINADKPDNVIDLISNIRSSNRLPTLREQMSNLNSEQKRINSEIDIIKTDIAEIKETLNDIKDGIRTVYNKENKSATPGPESVKKGNSPKSEGTFILSEEEEVQRSPQKTKKQTRPSGNDVKQESKAPVVKASSAETQTHKVSENIDFYRAMDLIKRNDFVNAISDLRKVISTENNPATINNCNYWIGESNFKLKDYNEAIVYFIKVVESPDHTKKDKAQVMIAECHIRTGKIPDAKKAYTNLIAQFPRSEYVPRARKMLQQL